MRVRSRVGYGLLVLVCLAWGATPLAIGFAVGPSGGFGPLWLNASRLLLAGLVLVGVAGLRGERMIPVGQWGLLLGLGLLGWSLGSGFQVVAQTEVASGLAALVLALGPALGLLFAASADGRVPGLAPVLGTVLGFSGVVLIVCDGGFEGSSLLPVGLLLASAASWAGASVIQARRPDGLSPAVSAGWQMIAGGVGLIVAAGMMAEPLPSPSLGGWLSWAYLAVFGGVIGFLGWVEVLRRVPVAVAMTQPTVSTLVAVALGHAIMGETLGVWAPHGIVLALVGAGVTLLPSLPVPRVSMEVIRELLAPFKARRRVLAVRRVRRSRPAAWLRR